MYKWVREYALGLGVTYIIWNYSAWEICLFVSIYLTIHFYQSEYVDIYFALWVINQWLYYCCCLFLFTLFTALSTGSPLCWLLCPSAVTQSSRSHLRWISGLCVSALRYILETRRCSMLTLYLLHQVYRPPFLKGTLAPFNWRMVSETNNLGARFHLFLFSIFPLYHSLNSTFFLWL